MTACIFRRTTAPGRRAGRLANRPRRTRTHKKGVDFTMRSDTGPTGIFMVGMIPGFARA